MHFANGSYNQRKWITVHHIVRADSLKEWDFENWKPKESKREENNKELLEF